MVHYKLYTLCQKMMLMQMDFSTKKYQPEIHTVYTSFWDSATDKIS